MRRQLLLAILLALPNLAMATTYTGTTSINNTEVTVNLGSDTITPPNTFDLSNDGVLDFSGNAGSDVNIGQVQVSAGSGTLNVDSNVGTNMTMSGGDGSTDDGALTIDNESSTFSGFGIEGDQSLAVGSLTLEGIQSLYFGQESEFGSYYNGATTESLSALNMATIPSSSPDFGLANNISLYNTDLTIGSLNTGSGASIASESTSGTESSQFNVQKSITGVLTVGAGTGSNLVTNFEQVTDNSELGLYANWGGTGDAGNLTFDGQNMNANSIIFQAGGNGNTPTTNAQTPTINANLDGATTGAIEVVDDDNGMANEGESANVTITANGSTINDVDLEGTSGTGTSIEFDADGSSLGSVSTYGDVLANLTDDDTDGITEQGGVVNVNGVTDSGGVNLDGGQMNVLANGMTTPSFGMIGGTLEFNLTPSSMSEINTGSGSYNVTGGTVIINATGTNYTKGLTGPFLYGTGTNVYTPNVTYFVYNGTNSDRKSVV